VSRIRPRRGPVAAVLLAVFLPLAIVLSSCGSDQQAPVGSARDATPADAVLYSEAVVRPEGDQADAIAALTGRFGGLDLGALIVSQIDAAATADGTDFSFADDVEPWLGQRAAIFFRDFSSFDSQTDAAGFDQNGALMIESTDDAAAQAFVDKAVAQQGGATDQTYNGHDYVTDSDGTAIAVDNGLLIIGNQDSVEATFDTIDGGSALVDEDAFSSRLDQGTLDGSLASVYVDVQAAVASSGSIDPASAQVFETIAPHLLDTPVTATVGVESDRVAVDVSFGSLGSLGQLYTSGGSPLLGELPADAWGATSYPSLGAAYKQLLDTFSSANLPGASADQIAAVEQQLSAATGVSVDDALGAIGDTALFIRGTDPLQLDGAAVIEINDPAVGQKLVDALRTAISAQPGAAVRTVTIGGASGFEFASPGLPREIDVVLDGDRAVIGYGRAATADALNPADRLGDSPTFSSASDAFGDSPGLGTVVDAGPLLSLITAAQSGISPQLSVAMPYLKHLDYVAAGTSDDGEVGHLRLVAGLD
jgi:Protein of unknown function (DUF3352)